MDLFGENPDGAVEAVDLAVEAVDLAVEAVDLASKNGDTLENLIILILDVGLRGLLGKAYWEELRDCQIRVKSLFFLHFSSKRQKFTVSQFSILIFVHSLESWIFFHIGGVAVGSIVNHGARKFTKAFFQHLTFLSCCFKLTRLRF